MSVTLVLLPLALGAAAAAGGVGALGAVITAANGRAVNSGSGSSPEVRVRTRMKDSTLLADALSGIGATAVEVSQTRVTAEVNRAVLTMSLTDDGVWEAHVEGHSVTVASATELVERLDAEYAERVQQAVAEKIRMRADGAGFDLVSETRESDDTVTMVLNVRTDA
ncbi:hypothetical protein [Mycetocola zhujimingii]|uniref:DUF1257 domain-containing protein n=1 Tax=Mycetocola zhujimingii TaxID=2079792 RepID=A0A2U1TBV4_9MICO|nr:hypothetical protein [Mycetocola zhujimingii]PWC06375.1 hypothetical protein DF223_12290 [Mycetocola zhujimingii]